MSNIRWKVTALALFLALALVGTMQAQQQHHHGGMGVDTEEIQETPGQTPMMEPMQGMMEHMQGMMRQMQGMMGRQMMGGMAPGEVTDREEEPFWGGMMGHHGSMAHGHDPGHHGGGFIGKMERMARQLELTDEQQAKLRSLIRTHIKGAIRTKADISVQRIDLRELLDTEPVDMTKVKTLLDSIASKQAALRFAHITLRQDMKKLLNPEQQEKFRTMRGHMTDYGGRMGPGRMMRRGGMGGPGGMKNPCGMMGGGTRNR